MNLGSARQLILGIEGGGTRTVAILAEDGGALVRRLEFGPANVRLLNDSELHRRFREIASAFDGASAIGVGLAGARTDDDRARVSRAIARLWPGVPALVTNDLETALLAASDGREPAARHRGSSTIRPPIPAAQVLVLSGTGSCCYGQNSETSAKVGGWGHLLGDKGSGYEIGLRGLKASVYYYDRDGRWPALGERLLRAVQLNEPNDLIGWVQSASKDDVARLAIEVFEAAAVRDRIARDIIEAAAHTLANDAVACAGRLARRGSPVEFVLAGSVLLNQPAFARKVMREIERQWPRARAIKLPRESAWGAVVLGRRALERAAGVAIPGRRKQAPQSRTDVELPTSTQLSPTEQRNPRSMNLHQMSISEAVALMLGEEARVAPAILAERKKLERVISWIVRAFRQGGRLFYAGAGTSGRLGVLDASECPPTFRASPEQVQGIIAGGQQALWRSVEGAEDDPGAGARAVECRGINSKDILVGIAASGRTPFVWGALAEANRRGARTVLVCFNPHLVMPKRYRPDMVIAPDIGPEVLTGSTRLKSGTATKLILNIFTTLSMVRSGKVIGNLMVDLNPSNKKLRERAVRILQTLTGVDDATARQELERAGWVVKRAFERLQETHRER